MTSLEQIGPYRSALNSHLSGPAIFLFSGVGSGAVSGYEISNNFPGARPIGPLVPTVMVKV